MPPTLRHLLKTAPSSCSSENTNIQNGSGQTPGSSVHHSLPRKMRWGCTRSSRGWSNASSIPSEPGTATTWWQGCNHSAGVGSSALKTPGFRNFERTASSTLIGQRAGIPGPMCPSSWAKSCVLGEEVKESELVLAFSFASAAFQSPPQNASGRGGGPLQFRESEFYFYFFFSLPPFFPDYVHAAVTRGLRLGCSLCCA
jgi:hypothetical protein